MINSKPAHKNKTYVFELNELSLLRFLVSILLKRDVRVLKVSSFLPPMTRYIGKITNWAFRTNRASYVVDEFPDLLPMWKYVTLVFAHDVFRKTEPWQNKYFDYENADATDSKFAMAYKLTSSKHLHWKYVSMFLLHAVAT